MASTHQEYAHLPAKVPTHKEDTAIASSRHLPGWQISGKPTRLKYQSKGYVLKDDAIIHREFKQKKGKKAVRGPPAVPTYPNDKFSPWQSDMARYLHEGYNVVADVVTSCGKTWAANLITAYEILARDAQCGAKSTALIISPNSEVMRDSVKDICEHHNKHYNYSTKMLDTLTRNFTTYDDKRAPASQILVISVECVEDFITDPINKVFVENLKIIVFDEVHLGGVTRALWWSQYVPHHAQLVLLSATLGDPEKVVTIVEDIQDLQGERPLETKVITYRVRPIPLQPLVFKGSEAPSNGVISSNLKGAKKLSCLINRYDPTKRDLTSILRTAENPRPIIPEDRDIQFEFGQSVVAQNMGIIDQKISDALEDVEVEPNQENIYNLLCYLFSNDKQPVMVFNTTAGATEHLCKRVVAHISQVEHEDEEYRVAQKQMDAYNKAQHRARDKKDRSKKNEKEKGDWSKPLPDEEEQDKVNVHALKKLLRKWRFPSDLTEVPDNMPQWIKDALEYGIGVYVSHMKVWQRHFMFDAFRDGKIKVLFSDSTISVGINLPIRTTVMCGYMSHSLYKQASGRAGRRGMDNQGYIVHMMSKPDILRCINTKVPEVHLNMPTKMTYSDLTRLLVPTNLQSYHQGDDPAFPKAEVIPEFSKTILQSYLSSLSEEDLEQCIGHIKMIHHEQWHYHRLTNMVKTLPEAASIILIKMLAIGVLHKFEPVDFINLMALLYNRIEWDGNIDEHSQAIGEGSENYYIPVFKQFPDLLKKLQKASSVYDLGIDFSKPIHNYFFQFCRKQKLSLDYLPQIELMGEWLYIFKRGVMSVSPMEGRGRKKKPCDKFVKMVDQVDNEYMAARVSQSI